MKKLIGNLILKIISIFGNKDDQDVRSVAGYRMLRLLPGDCAVVVKKNNDCFIVESDLTDEEGRMMENEELAWMLGLYSKNSDYVDILKQMFQDNIDDINSHRVVKEREK